MRVGLVGCVKNKAATATPAADLYISPLFKGRKAYVQQSCDSWYILSAKYGLLRPTTVVEPYDETLTSASKAQKAAWSTTVLAALPAELGDLAGLVFEIHAGAAYSDSGLAAGLAAAGATVEMPAGGLPIGKLLAFYANGLTPASGGPTTVASGPSAVPAGRLTEWLSTARSPVDLTFADIEHILGKPLPPSAHKYPAWWANSPSHGLAKQWLAGGWHAEKLDLKAQRVRLVR